MAEIASLEAAAKAGSLDEVTRILGADPEVSTHPTSMGVSALLVALYYGHREVAESIASFKSLDLFEAAALGDALTVGDLGQKGDANAFSADGFTALGYAAFFGHLSACKELLKAGADPNLRSANGLGVLPHHSALANGSVEIARLLIEAGADPKTASNEGWTALHYVAHSGDVETAKWLLSLGVSPTANASGQSPSDLAREAGHLDQVDLFVGLSEESNDA